MAAGRHERSEALLKPAVELHPRVWFLHEYRGLNELARGDYMAARRAFESCLELHDVPETVALLGYAAARSGRRNLARSLRSRLDRTTKRRVVAWSFRAIVEAGLGELDRGMEMLERAYEEREPPLRYLAALPCYSDYWGRPDFSDLLRRLALPEPPTLSDRR